MNQEQNEEKKEQLKTEQDNSQNPPVFDSEDFLRVLEHIEKELKSEKVFRTSFKWYINLLIELIFYIGIGISLLNVFPPFKYSNIFIALIYIIGSALLCGLVKVYTHLSNKPLMNLIGDYINYVVTVVVSIVLIKFIPGIISVDYVMLVIYIMAMLLISEMIGKFFKKLFAR